MATVELIIQCLIIDHCKCNIHRLWSITSINFSYCIFVAEPKVTVAVDNLDDIEEGNDVTITCETKGNPLPTVRWDITDEIGVVIGDNVNHTGNRNEKIIRRNLTISNILREHTGVYTCSANNSVGSDSNSICITVQCKFVLAYFSKIKMCFVFSSTTNYY